MKRIEALIRHYKLEEVKNALTQLGVQGMTVIDARGFGRQRGHREMYRGAEYTVDFVPKVYLLVCVPDEMAPKVVECIMKVGYTGMIGDGMIFVSNLEHVFRIRTGETGDEIL